MHLLYEINDVLHFNDKLPVVRHKFLYVVYERVRVLKVCEYTAADNHVCLTILLFNFFHRRRIKERNERLQSGVIGDFGYVNRRFNSHRLYAKLF